MGDAYPVFSVAKLLREFERAVQSRAGLGSQALRELQRHSERRLQHHLLPRASQIGRIEALNRLLLPAVTFRKEGERDPERRGPRGQPNADRQISTRPKCPRERLSHIVNL